MNSKFAILCFAVGCVSACAPSPGPIEIAGFVEVDPQDCEAPTDLKKLVTNGNLLVNSGRPAFLVGAGLVGLDGFSAGTISRSDGRTLDLDKRDNPFIDEVALSYKATPSIGSFKAEVVKVAGAGPGAGTLVIKNNLITQAAADVIAGGMAPSDSTADVVTLNVTVEYRGHLSRSGTRITSGAALFPIKLRRPTAGECPRAGGPSGNNGYKFAAAECGTSGQFAAPTCCDPTMDSDCLVRP